jgi:hypothetical protein
MNTEVPIPKRLQERPFHRGLPIPYIAFIAQDGVPDFRVIDQDKRMEVAVHRQCQLCGQPLGRFMFFVGGPGAAAANQYFEPPLHMSCLIYAMQVCPFIVGKILEHADIGKVQKKHTDAVVTADETFLNVRQPEWVIKKALDFQFAITPQKTILFLPRKILAQTGYLYPDKMGPEDWELVVHNLKNNKQPRKEDNERSIRKIERSQGDLEEPKAIRTLPERRTNAKE